MVSGGSHALNKMLVDEGSPKRAPKGSTNGPPRVILGGGTGISRDGSGVALGPSLTISLLRASWAWL